MPPISPIFSVEAPAFVDPNLCPLCGQTNQCAMEIERTTGVKQPPCWCTQATFSAALIARIPEKSQGKACICSACGLSF